MDESIHKKQFSGRFLMYKCNVCGNQTVKWMGRCPDCGKWDTLEEVVEDKGSKRLKAKGIKPVKLSDISTHEKDRIKTNIGEFDRVVGGGIVPGSIVLISGEPGIGKSTLLLTLTGILSEHIDVMYISGEESKNQIKIRAKRLDLENKNIDIISDTDVDGIINTISENNPDLVVIDSIQTMNIQGSGGVPGSVSTIREVTSNLIRIGKKRDITVLIVGHITKSGNIAGPMTLEHMVDTVLFMEGDKTHSFRLLRSEKNRFGSTDEVGIFNMDEKGLQEVKNPSKFLISEREENTSGSVVVPTVEGTRPLMIEIQSLVIPTRFSYPQRVAQGFPDRKLNLLMAVIQKRLNLEMSDFDVYCNIAGGMSIFEPSIDLGIIISIISSLLEESVTEGLCMVGEVGLSGEIRAVPSLSSRIKEAERIGFNKILVPERNRDFKADINVMPVKNISQAKEICQL